MTEVIIERHPDAPLSTADAVAIIKGGNECRAIHRLTWHRSLLSSDGQQMICHVTSPDLESVRIALKSGGQPMRADVWSLSIRDAPNLTLEELARANVLASWNLGAPATAEQLDTIEQCGGVCSKSHRVRFLRSYVASDRRRVLSLCAAADAESVRLALRDAEPPVQRVWAFRQFLP